MRWPLKWLEMEDLVSFIGKISIQKFLFKNFYSKNFFKIIFLTIFRFMTIEEQANMVARVKQTE